MKKICIESRKRDDREWWDGRREKERRRKRWRDREEEAGRLVGGDSYGVVTLGSQQNCN